MLLGGLKFKEQRFSRSAAGVSSVLLLLSIIAAFLPTLFFAIFGASQMYCGDCEYDLTSMGDGTEGTDVGEYDANCGFCYNRRVDLAFDPVYDRAEHLSFASAFLMPVAYCLGLFFTLKTHTHIYDLPEDEDEEKAGLYFTFFLYFFFFFFVIHLPFPQPTTQKNRPRCPRMVSSQMCRHFVSLYHPFCRSF